MRIFTYDTTLRDGAQSDTVFYSKNDKLNIIRLLDSLGIDFIEVDNPVYNPYDDGFFEELKNMKLNHSRIVAFGSTVKVGVQPQNDSVLSFLSSYSDCCAISAKRGIFMFRMC